VRRLSLRLRLACAGAVTVAVAITLSSLGLAALFDAHVKRRALVELSVQLDQVLAGVERASSGALEQTATPADPRFQRPYGGLYWQIAAEGGMLRSRSLWDYEIPLPLDELRDGAEHVHELPGPAGQPLLAIERSVVLPRRLGGAGMRATVAMDRTELAAARNGFISDLAPYSVVLTVALILAGWVQIAVGLRPLRVIRQRVADVRSGRARRLGADFPAEVLPLVREVDALLAARGQEVARARTRAGDLAHGLKTPLQALLGEAGRLRAEGRTGVAADIEAIAGAMRRHVDRELARTRVAMRGHEARAEIAPALAGVLRVVRRTGEGAGRDWQLEVPAGLAVAADPDDLTEALGALIENAARHARRRVRITAVAAEGAVTISVCDDGPGIPADRIGALMARGARADTQGQGSGLGLAIARDIAEALEGELTLHPATPGLEARLRLPGVCGPPRQ